MITLLFATENVSKADRFRKNLLKRNIKLITLNDLDRKLNIEENGNNAIENALIKARTYAKIYNYPILGMDDNLYIENIPEKMQPGMFVRRVNGKRLTDEEMIEYYSNLASEYGNDGKLTCRWIYGLALIYNGIEKTYTWSKENFYIVDKPSDKINPGYPLNSISIHKKLNKYFTDIIDEDKKSLDDNDSNVIDFICNNLEDMEGII